MPKSKFYQFLYFFIKRNGENWFYSIDTVFYTVLTTDSTLTGMKPLQQTTTQKTKKTPKPKGSDISDADYGYALNVWILLKISNLVEYSDLYFKLYVSLLFDVFEHFWNFLCQIIHSRIK